MNKYIQWLCTTCLAVVCSLSALQAQTEGVIPMPLQIEKGSGHFRLSPQTRLHTNLKGAEKKRLAHWLQSQSPLLNRKLHGAKHAASNYIYLQKVSAEAFAAQAQLPHPASTQEAYRMQVEAHAIVITAPTDAGLFYGLQSLQQWAQAAGTSTWQVPVMNVDDAPRFAYRGFMIDVSRHFRTVDFLKKQMDAMAYYKLNRLHLHLTDAAGWRLQIKRYPKLTDLAAWRPDAHWKVWWNEPGKRKYCTAKDADAYGGFYTRQDVKDLLAYAAERHITLIPEIEMPGHSEEVLAAYPELACSGKPYTNADFCIGNEATFTFLENVLKEVMDLFPSEYIHIGGDEATKKAWKTCPKCQQRMKEEGLADVDELQSYLIRRMDKFLQQHGRKLLGWDEIMQGGLASGAAVMSWRGESGGLTAAKAGHRVVMTPGAYCYFDKYQDAPHTQPEAIGGYVPLKAIYEYNPVPDSFTPEQAACIYGVQANLWAEYIPTDNHYEYMMYPRLLALAEVAWSRPETKSYDAFRQRALREVSRLEGEGYHPFPLKDEIGQRPGTETPVTHLALHKPVKYNAPFNQKYRANGEQTLTDGYCGGWS